MKRVEGSIEYIWVKFCRYRARAKKKGLEFKLEYEVFERLLTSPCYYCGYNDEHNGIDRANNNMGYTLSNSIPSCVCCNIMKRDMSITTFLKKVEMIYHHTRYFFFFLFYKMFINYIYIV